MTICGIEIKGSEAIIAVASQDNQALTHVALATKKIALEDDDEAANVKAFAAQVSAFVRENGISRIAIKKRSKKGEFAGGPTTFKIEGVFQLLEGVEVTLLSPQTINAQNKKHTFELPATLNKYQHEAFKTACSALLKKYATPKSTVGGGLLPMVVDQLAHALADIPLSGASPLPHWVCGVFSGVYGACAAASRRTFCPPGHTHPGSTSTPAPYRATHRYRPEWSGCPAPRRCPCPPMPC